MASGLALLAVVAAVLCPPLKWRAEERRRQRRLLLQVKRVDEVGFAACGVDVAWADVRLIATYKHDRFAFDEVAVAFDLADGSSVEVLEHDPLFEPLMRAVEGRFPAVPRDWFADVVQPPMATNYRVLWTAAAPAGSV